MKVRVTFDINDTDRIAISVLAGNGFTPAPRDHIEAYLSGVVNTDLRKLRERFDVATQQIIGELDTEEA